MTVQTKTIGRMPTHHGDYDPSVAYGNKYRVTLYGCEWESKHDNNNTAPAVWDGGDTITPNTTDWTLISGSFDTWLESLDKPASTGTTGDYPYNGMGRVKLEKNIVNSVNTLTQDMFYKGAVGSRVPNTNTIFVIRYDYVLGEDITVPENCILKFDGGSISGLHTVTGDSVQIKAPNNKIFDGITFAGNMAQNNLFHISWFVDKSSSVFYTESEKGSAVDCSDQINAAFASGARRFIWDSDRYYYLTNPIEIWGNIDIYSDVDDKFANSRSQAVVNGQCPCVYSYDIVTMFKYHAIVNEYYKDCINLDGITFLCAKPFSNPTTDQNTPVVFIETGCPADANHDEVINNTTLWGLRVGFIVRGINRNGGIIGLNDVLVDDTISVPSYTGISLNATRGNLTYVRIDGYYTKLFNAIVTNLTSPYWFSDITIYADINQCGHGGIFNGVTPIKCYGTGQPSMIWTSERSAKESFYRGSNRVYIYGFVWDLGSSRTTSGGNVYRNCQYQYDSFENVSVDTANYASESYTQKQPIGGGQIVDMSRHPSINAGNINLLNCIFNNRDIISKFKYELEFPDETTESVVNFDVPDSVVYPVITTQGTNFVAYNVFNLFKDAPLYKGNDVGMQNVIAQFQIISSLQTKIHIYVEFASAYNVYKGNMDYFYVRVPKDGSSTSATPVSPVVTVVDNDGTHTMTPNNKIVSSTFDVFVYFNSNKIHSIDVTYTVAGSVRYKAASLFIPCNWMDFYYIQNLDVFNSKDWYVAANGMYFNLYNKKPVYLVEGNIYDADGVSANVNRVGTTADRPSISDVSNGFMYFDTTLGKPIYKNGTDWVDATGSPV